jgi:hypothetical protein
MSPVRAAGLLPRAEIVPPIRHGDAFSYRLADGDTLVVVDGLFLQVASVRHRELLALLDAGVRVVGCSSMGALRAAELQEYGMIGFGSVFDGYLDGSIVGDDEVAVVHGTAEDGYPIFAEALVNIRATLRAARDSSVLDGDAHDLVLAVARDRGFVDRQWPAVVATARTAGLDPATADCLVRFVREHAVDVKRRDALQLFAGLGSVGRSGHRAGNQAQRSRSYFLQRWRAEYGVPDDRDDAPTLLAAAAAYDGEFPAWRHAWLLIDVAAHHAGGPAGAREGCLEDDVRRAAQAVEQVTGGPVEPWGPDWLPALETVAEVHARAQGLFASDGPPATVLDRFLTPAERTMTDTRQIAALVTRSWQTWPGVALDGMLRRAVAASASRAALATEVTRAARVNTEFARRNPGHTLDRLEPHRVAAAYLRRWREDNASVAFIRRGFPSPAAGAAALGPFLLHSMLNGPPRITLQLPAPGATMAGRRAVSR